MSKYLFIIFVVLLSTNFVYSQTDSTTTKTPEQTDPTIFYTVQVGAGSVKKAYFDKVLDVRSINCKDGIMRFVSGKFPTKEEAFLQRQRLIFLGYEDAFVRVISKDDVIDLSPTGIVKPEK